MTIIFPKNKLYTFKKDKNGFLEYSKSTKD